MKAGHLFFLVFNKNKGEMVKVLDHVQHGGRWTRHEQQMNSLHDQVNQVLMLEQVLWSAWRWLNPTWSRREITSGQLGKCSLRPAQTRCAFLLLAEGAAAAFNTSGSTASCVPPRALAAGYRRYL